MAEGTSAGSATGAASKSTEAAAPEQERSAPMQPSARGLTASPLPTQPSLRRIESSREITPAPEARAPSTAASSDRQQREAWTQWYAAMRESPDSTVRLQALEQWAQQPGAPLDPVTYALVDGDEAVRARAQDLYSHQLTREAVAAPPTPKAGEGPQAAP